MNISLMAKILVAAAFIAGAYLASLDPKTMYWPAFVPIVLAGLIGAYLSKKADNAAANHGDVVTVNRAALEESMNNIVANLEKLNADKANIPTYDMRFEIDRLLRDDLNRFADARDTMKSMFGLQSFADIMSSFAAGERYINRVWSASTDGYIDEVMMYVEKSLTQFREAQEVYAEAKAKAAAA